MRHLSLCAFMKQEVTDGRYKLSVTQEATWGGDRKGENAKIQVEDKSHQRLNKWGRSP